MRLTYTRVVCALVVFAAIVCVSVPVYPQFITADKIEPALRERFTRQRDVSYVVYLKERADLTVAATAIDRRSRGVFAYQLLRATADRSQAPLRALLAEAKRAGRIARYRTFVAVNAISVTSSQDVLASIAADPAVDRIVLARTASIPTPIAGTALPRVQGIEWNISRVHAPETWSRGVTGQGIVVANIDTGVQFDHPALVRQYRGNNGDGTFDHNYNWFDPDNACGSPSAAPCDHIGHGTHTMGTMVGDDGAGNQIGVAPGAKWVACNACPDGNCDLDALLACGDWMLAPTDLAGNNPDPARRPDIVNNSWAFSIGGVSVYRDIVASWRAAGIFPAFSSGNTGPGCGSVTSPGDYPEAIAAGAVDTRDVLGSFSGRGPSVFDGVVKPDLVAPGVNVRSSIPNGDYAAISGTSMASPHVAGAVALLWSQYPALRHDLVNTERQLKPSADILNSTEACGIDGPTSHPNNSFGFGRVDATRATVPFGIHTDRSSYGTGETMTASLALQSPYVSPTSVDLYVIAQGPTGPAFLLGPPSTQTLTPGLETLDAPFFNHTFGPSDPVGVYLFLTLMTPHGADPGIMANWISLDGAALMRR